MNYCYTSTSQLCSIQLDGLVQERCNSTANTLELRFSCTPPLTHWGRVTHLCVSKLTTIGSDNGLSPGRHQAIIWTNAGILLIGPIGTNFSEILIEIKTFSLMKMYLKMSSGKWRPFCLGLNVLICRTVVYTLLISSTTHLPPVVEAPPQQKEREVVISQRFFLWHFLPNALVPGQHALPEKKKLKSVSPFATKLLTKQLMVPSYYLNYW